MGVNCCGGCSGKYAGKADGWCTCGFAAHCDKLTRDRRRKVVGRIGLF